MLFKKKSKRFTGLVFEYYNDKQPKVEINVVNGLKDGIFSQYYENGKLQVESKFKKGKLVGKFTAFHENGNEQIITFYKENLRMGSFEEFYDNKKLKLSHSVKHQHRAIQNSIYSCQPITLLALSYFA